MFKESSLVVILLVIALILAFSSFAVQNAYDKNNIDEIVDSMETYTNTDAISYSNNTVLFTRGYLREVTHNGKPINIPEEYLGGNWTHGILNYPMLILQDESDSQLINLETKGSILSSEELKKTIIEQWDRIINLDNNFDTDILTPDIFSTITTAQLSSDKEKVAFIVESKFISGTVYSVIGVYDLKSEETTVTNISRGGFTHSEYGGDLGPFWAPNGQEFAYTLGDRGDTATDLYINYTHSENMTKISGDTLTPYLNDPNQPLNFPGFRDLKWAKEGSKLFFSTREQDNSDKVIKWVIDTSTSTIDLLD